MVGFHLLDGAGHWVQQERAEEVSGLLVRFLRGKGRLDSSGSRIGPAEFCQRSGIDGKRSITCLGREPKATKGLLQIGVSETPDQFDQALKTLKVLRQWQEPTPGQDALKELLAEVKASNPK
jgi:hypothetical protein